MVELKNKSIVETFNAKLKTPWVWLVILLTVGLTILFYFSQKPQIVIYSRHTKALCEYQLLESTLMRSMDGIRMGVPTDSLLIQSQTMTLREIAVSFSRQMDELRTVHIAAPSEASVAKFERAVLGKVAGIRRYMELRKAWFKKLEESASRISPEALSENILRLDSARIGFPVLMPEGTSLSKEDAKLLSEILAENAELSFAWSRFDNGATMMATEELMQFFQMESLNEIALKSKIPMVFYFLSLVLLLSTFFFLFKSRL